MKRHSGFISLKPYRVGGLSDDRRPQGKLSSHHQALAHALDKDNGEISHCRRRLETRGRVELDLSSDGQVDDIGFTSAGRKWVVKFEGSYD